MPGRRVFFPGQKGARVTGVGLCLGIGNVDVGTAIGRQGLHVKRRVVIRYEDGAELERICETGTDIVERSIEDAQSWRGTKIRHVQPSTLGINAQPEELSAARRMVHDNGRCERTV